VWSKSRAWLALALLFTLYALPDGVRDGAFRPRSLRFSGDLFVILTMAAVSYRIAWGRWVRPLFVGFAVILCLVRVDRVLMRGLMYEEPLLYDQLFMAQHLFVLISDLWSTSMALAVSGVVVGVAGLIWGCARLLKVARDLLSPERSGDTLRVAYAAWLLVLFGSVSDVAGLTKQPAVQWFSPLLAENVDQSLWTYRAVKRSFGESPYQAYDSVRLTKTPDIHLYVVESYGRVIWDEKPMHSFFDGILKRLEQRLADAGVQSVSAFSTSNIRGGRSWLADGAIIMGTPIRYEAVFHHALRYAKSQTTLVSFLKKQGYETLLVAPADRARLGLVVENRYDYDRIVAFNELNYHGKPYGWGMIPDQHTIGFVAEQFVARAQKPQFLNFHLVSSHAPWRDVPPRVEDWHALSTGDTQSIAEKHDAERALKGLAQRYDRVDTGINFRPALGKYVRGYLWNLEYDLELLVDEIIRETKGGRLTILIGDHQPPLITSLNSSYDSPIHVFSRDPALLNEFRAQGFEDGLRLLSRPKPAMGHGGLFSLLARALMRNADSSAELPPFLREGREVIPNDRKK